MCETCLSANQQEYAGMSDTIAEIQRTQLAIDYMVEQIAAMKFYMPQSEQDAMNQELHLLEQRKNNLIKYLKYEVL